MQFFVKYRFLCDIDWCQICKLALNKLISRKKGSSSTQKGSGNFSVKMFPFSGKTVFLKNYVGIGFTEKTQKCHKKSNSKAKYHCAQCGKMINLLLLKKIFRQITYLVLSLVKTLLWRNFCQKRWEQISIISTLCTG